MFGDIERLVEDPAGASISIMTDPLDIVGSGGKIQSPALFGRSKDNPVDQLTAGDIQALLKKGRERGESLAGISSSEVGDKRSDIRSRYKNIINAPSRGAARTAQARNANLKRLRASQGQRGVSGGMADLQESQMSQDYAGRVGNVRQKEYMDALNKLERQYRGAAQDIMTAEGQYGAIGAGSKSAPTAQSGGGITYLCTELNRRNLITKWELFFIHALLIIGTILRPSETIFYLLHGNKLVCEINNDGKLQWQRVKDQLFDTSLNKMKQLKFLSAVNHYIQWTEWAFNRYSISTNINRDWSFSKVIKSFKVMREVYNG